MKEINNINAAKNHKPFHPVRNNTKILNTNLEKIKQLSQQYPYINFEDELAYFSILHV